MYCRKCGNSIAEEDDFCTNCGAPVPKSQNSHRKKISGRKCFLGSIFALAIILGSGIIIPNLVSNGLSKSMSDFESNISKEDSRGVLLPILRNEKCGYINELGKMIIEPKYDNAEGFGENGLARVSLDEKWGYIDKAGNEVIPLEYDPIWGFSVQGLARVKQNGKYGYVNKDGKLTIPCIYDNAETFADNGLALVVIAEKYGYINTEGDVVVPCQYEYAGSFADNGLACVEKGEKYGFIDQYGDVVIDIQYEDAGDFYGSNLAPVCENGKWGYIDKNGNEMIEFKYDQADSFINGSAYVEISDKEVRNLIDESGNIICSFDEKYNSIYPFENGLIRVTTADINMGCINRNGEVVIDASYVWVNEMSDGLMIAWKEERKGAKVIDEYGKVIISVENGGISEGAEGYYFVYKDGIGQSIEESYYNGKGEEIIPFQNNFDRNSLKEIKQLVQTETKGEEPDKRQLRFPFSLQSGKVGMMDGYGHIIADAVYTHIYFEDEENYEEGLFHVHKKGKHGYINRDGEVVIPIEYDNLGKIDKKGLILAEKDEKFGWINVEGEEVIPLQYDSANAFGENELAPVEKDGQWGYIDYDGKQVLAYRYDSAKTFAKNGMAAVESGGKYGYINEKGQDVIACKYDNALSFDENGIAAVMMDEKWGFIDEQGREKIMFQYDDARGFDKNGLACVKKDGKWGYINTKNQVVIPFEFKEAYSFEANGTAVVDGGVIDEKGKYILEGYDYVCGAKNFFQTLKSYGIGNGTTVSLYDTFDAELEKIIPFDSDNNQNK